MYALSSARRWRLVRAAAIAAACLAPTLALTADLSFTCSPDGTLESYRLGDHAEVSFRRNPVTQNAIADAVCGRLSGCIDRLRGLVDEERHQGIFDYATKALAEVLKAVASERAQLEKAAEGSDELRQSLANLRQSLRACELQAGNDLRPEDNRIALGYPHAGPNRAKAAPNYDRAKIEEIVRAGLASQVDPFLALGVVLLENPPLPNPKADKYAASYGLLPIDSLAAFDQLGCLAPSPKRAGKRVYTQDSDVTEYLANEARQSRFGQERVKLEREFDDRPRDAKYRTSLVTGESAEEFLKERCGPATDPADTELADLCPRMRRFAEVARGYDDARKASRDLIARLGRGDRARMVAVEGELQCDDKCSAFFVPQRRVPLIDVRVDYGPTAEHLFCTRGSSLGHGTPTGGFTYSDANTDARDCCVKVRASSSINQYALAEKLKSALALDFMSRKVLSRESQPISGMIQTYNGLGKVGATEKLDSSCYAGIDMARTPVYGARVADLMVNTLMANPEIQGVVQNVAAEYRQPVPSLFCRKHGPGTHRIDADQFYAEQKRYLAGRAGCARFFR